MCYMFLCVCACARTRAFAFARVALLIENSTPVRRIVCSPSPPYFSTFSNERQDFRKNLLNIKYVFRFSLRLLFEKLLILRRTQRDIDINMKTSSCKVPAILVGFE